MAFIYRYTEEDHRGSSDLFGSIHRIASTQVRVLISEDDEDDEDEDEWGGPSDKYVLVYGEIWDVGWKLVVGVRRDVEGYDDKEARYEALGIEMLQILKRFLNA